MVVNTKVELSINSELGSEQFSKVHRPSKKQKCGNYHIFFDAAFFVASACLLRELQALNGLPCIQRDSVKTEEEKLTECGN